MHSFSKGTGKVEVQLRWDPSPLGTPPDDLDIIAATFLVEDPSGQPAYLVHFGSRSPDGTIIQNRDSRDGKGLGVDESMTLELDRIGDAYGRVVVGVAIQQRDGRRVFGEVLNPDFRVVEGHTELARGDFSDVSGATAATVAEFTRNDSGEWEFHELVRGFDTDANAFAQTMGSAHR
ncbi:TerD family protein [Streptomyces sp. NPDC051976]|uniref:TerD family protein n=1 Tax=Streptomyces sp. NPDC051976 TaxID=3154947 RepID=UPI003440BD08